MGPVAEKVRWLTGPRTVAAGDETCTARRGIVIATGSKSFIAPIPGLDEVDYWTTHDVIAMKEVPEYEGLEAHEKVG